MCFSPVYPRGSKEVGKIPAYVHNAVMRAIELAGTFLHYWIPVALCIWDSSPGGLVSVFCLLPLPRLCHLE